ncbi:Lethal(2) giant larvae protein-like protein 1 isoform X2 [Oopsacas minuta]|uniref:Lethal(2) giant larvae protein-like protein 1 isoform X2 n=1 Tax=Oopsacas minuta TaxID=111878 RepID=A0AAV7KCG4_9METZ|nr:Lethal(2) giant larvae protein-like protein 1 isoform X2 [Oopsacas minuta]
MRGRPSMRGAHGRGTIPIHPIAQQSQQGNALTVVKCLTFTTTFISGSNAQLCLWAGTSEGSVLRMSISVPSKGNRKNRITEVNLVGKPLYLRRASALTRITVLDAANQVQLPVGAKGIRGPHTVLMCSEDYIKIMNLPGMKKKSKERLRIDENDDLRLIRTELLSVNGVMCLTTLDTEGQLSIYSLPDMKLLYRIPIIEPTDCRALKSMCMTPSGLIISQSSQLQFQKYSLIEISRFLRIATLGEGVSSPKSEKSSQSFHSQKLI